MNERPCIRCRHPLALDEGQLTYCSVCGAPQIFLSEELSAQLAESLRAHQESQAPVPSRDASEPGTSARVPRRGRGRGRPIRRAGQRRPAPGAPWTTAVPYALLAAGVTLALGALSLLLPPFTILLLLWFFAAPVLTVGYFSARGQANPQTGVMFAARLGLLTGFMVACGTAIVFTASLLLTRFALHQPDVLDTSLAAMFDQQRAAVLARVGSSAQPTLDLFLIPEYRVGMLLFALATSAAMYMLLSTLVGGVAGAVLRRRREL